ncbi:hypothetical protein, partial [Actinotignum sp. GS-2025b]
HFMSTRSLDGQMIVARLPCHYSIILWCGMDGKVVQSSAGSARRRVAFLVVGGFIFCHKNDTHSGGKRGGVGGGRAGRVGWKSGGW